LDLQRALDLERMPRRIRCFDVSQLFGTHVVASMVTFVDGRPAKGEYRRYRIRTVHGPGRLRVDRGGGRRMRLACGKGSCFRPTWS